jgi:hypothetical protein
VVLMPSYVNIGAYVDEGTMVDTWATVGSCAQIGKNVHLSGGVGIGGVLEPVQANPTIIEDNCFIGARSEVVEGVIVEENSVLSMGVYIGQSTKIYDRETGEITYGRVPAGASWSRAACPRRGKYSLYCAVIVKKVDAQDPRQDRHQRAAARRLKRRETGMSGNMGWNPAPDGREEARRTCFLSAHIAGAHQDQRAGAELSTSSLDAADQPLQLISELLPKDMDEFERCGGAEHSATALRASAASACRVPPARLDRRGVPLHQPGDIPVRDAQACRRCWASWSWKSAGWCWWSARPAQARDHAGLDARKAQPDVGGPHPDHRGPDRVHVPEQALGGQPAPDRRDTESLQIALKNACARRPTAS